MSLVHIFMVWEKFVETKVPFSWMSQGSLPMGGMGGGAQPQVSEISGVDKVGNDFMKSLFAIPANGVGIATNQPKTMIYVVRILDENRNFQQLNEDFVSGQRRGVMEISRQEQQGIAFSLFEDLNREMKVDWGDHIPRDFRQ